MSNPVYDAVVVGAGIEGSATAYTLVKNRQRTLLLEQFPLPHTRGSSHGQSRIIRMAYPEDFYTAMMHDAFRIFAELEKESGVKLFRKTGLLCLGHSSSTYLPGVKRSLEKNSIVYQEFSNDDIRRRYPMVNFPDTYGGILEERAGILHADKVLRAFQEVFQRHGGILRDEEEVTSIKPGDVITVTTSKGTYGTRNIVLAAGPWTSRLLSPLGIRLPLQPIKTAATYWREKIKGSFSVDNFHCVLDYRDAGCPPVYLVPSAEYPGYVKMGMRFGLEVDPDERDAGDISWVKQKLTPYVKSRFPTLEPKIAIIEYCVQTNTPDFNFVLDRHPKWRNIIVASGFSGHGFGLAPSVGKVLTELLIEKPPSYDMSHFRIDRFPVLPNCRLNRQKENVYS